MVSKNDLSRANELAEQYLAIKQAIVNLQSGGQIIEMTISGASPHPNITVPTAYMSYPEQMVHAIEGLMTTRQEQINQELVGMGVQIDLEAEVLPGEPEPEPEPEPGEPGEPGETEPPGPQDARYRFRRTGP